MFAICLLTACHDVVDPAPYYDNCLYDVCNCKPGGLCECDVFAQYSLDCAHKGVVLNWRDQIDECKIECSNEELVYRECGPSCYSSCASLESTFNCTEQCVQGCSCPDGMVLDRNRKCVTPELCSCEMDGSVYKTGDVVKKGCGECTCFGGSFVCSDTQCPLSCGVNEETTKCVPECVKTCGNMHEFEDCSSAQCLEGCKCKDGYVWDGFMCILPSQCPCHHAGKSHMPNDVIKIECNKLQCNGTSWLPLTDHDCPVTCVAWGDPHYETFDGKKYGFQGACEYILVTNYLYTHSNSDFQITAANEPCGTSKATCTKVVTLTVGSGRNKQTIVLDRYSEVPASSKTFDVTEVGLSVFVHTDIGVTLVWDKKTRVDIKVEPFHKNTLGGLCGTYNGNQEDDFTKSNGGFPVVSAKEFANSWKTSESCGDAPDVGDPCEDNPHRKPWSQRKCSIIKSNTFKECHNLVPYEEYYTKCMYDACGCDSGGDCECLCIAIAAYAQACNEQDVPIKWRSQELCPIQCEGCFTYDPCVSICDSCGYTDNRDRDGHCEDTCVEGCKCPDGEYFDDGECVKTCPEPTTLPTTTITTTTIPTTTKESTTKESTTMKPTTTQPTTAEPTTTQSTIVDQTTTRSTTAEPPSTVISTTTESTTEIVTVTYPDVSTEASTTSSKPPPPPRHSTTLESTTAKVTTPEPPTTAESTTTKPTTSVTTAESTTTAEPTTSVTTAKPTTTAEPTTSVTTAKPTTSVTTAEPTTSVTTAEPTTSVTTAEPTTSVTTAESTTTVTTKPTTTETTTVTTKCVPQPTKMCWTDWFNDEGPGDKITPFDEGEFELLADLRKVYPICENPADIECTFAYDPYYPASETGQELECRADLGLTCLNDFPIQTCYDYRVRFSCPCPDQPPTCELDHSTVTEPTTSVPTTIVPTTKEHTTQCIETPIECWTDWMNDENGNKVPDSALGEFELLDELQKDYQFCDNPSAIECRVASEPNWSYYRTGQEVECNLETGLTCYHSSNESCYDYEIRVRCECEDQPFPICSTTAALTTESATTVRSTTKGRTTDVKNDDRTTTSRVFTPPRESTTEVDHTTAESSTERSTVVVTYESSTAAESTTTLEPTTLESTTNTPTTTSTTPRQTTTPHETTEEPTTPETTTLKVTTSKQTTPHETSEEPTTPESTTAPKTTKESTTVQPTTELKQTTAESTTEESTTGTVVVTYESSTAAESTTTLEPTTLESTTNTPTETTTTPRKTTTPHETTEEPTTPESTPPSVTTSKQTTPHETSEEPTTPESTTAPKTTKESTTVQPTTELEQTTAESTTEESTTGTVVVTYESSTAAESTTTLEPTTLESTTNTPTTPPTTPRKTTTPHETTEEPTTPESTTAPKTTKESTTVQPTTEFEQTTAESSTEESTTTLEPTTLESTTNTPPTTPRKTTTPHETSEEPTTPESTTPSKTTKESTTVQPTTEFKQTTAESSTEESTTTLKPTTLESTTNTPPTTPRKTTTPHETSEEPTTPESTTAPKTTKESTTVQPTTELEQTTAESTTEESTTGTVVVTYESSTAAESTTTLEPTTLESTTNSPTEPPTTPRKTTTPHETTEEPTTPESTTPSVTTRKQTTPHETSEEPTTPESTTAPKTTKESTTVQPTTEVDHTTAESSTEMSTTGTVVVTYESSTAVESTTTLEPTTIESTTNTPTTPPTTPRKTTPHETSEEPTTPESTTPTVTTRKQTTPHKTSEEPTTPESTTVVQPTTESSTTHLTTEPTTTTVVTTQPIVTSLPDGACECSGYGDPHYFTFDGKSYDHQGNCTYILSRDASPEHQYTVYIHNEECANFPGTTCPESMTVLYKNYTIVMQHDFEFNVSGNVVYAPAYFDGIELRQNGLKMMVIVAAIGLEVRFEPLSPRYFRVVVSAQLFWNNTEGLCGLCNNITEDDFISREGKVISDPFEFGYEWLESVNGDEAHCIPQVKPTQCIPSQEIIDWCGNMNSTVFQSCHPYVDPREYFKTCIRDNCAEGFPGNCWAFESYAEECSGLKVCIPWRSDDFCPETCPDGLVYRQCNCPIPEVDSCSSWEEFDCPLDPIAGCFCPEGTVPDGTHPSNMTCIPCEVTPPPTIPTTTNPCPEVEPIGCIVIESDPVEVRDGTCIGNTSSTSCLGKCESSYKITGYTDGVPSTEKECPLCEPVRFSTEVVDLVCPGNLSKQVEVQKIMECSCSARDHICPDILLD
ncbi:uncharacterized protein [Antedon mediterranea]|uniref:uncharacterized protein n=1 Tax=Antedon mediterranea TaxID=105859 RepID=UPI003AF644C2